MTTELGRSPRGSDDEEGVTISPHECSVKGGERILVTFPHHVPSSEPVLLVFSGSQQRHEVVTGRHSPTSLYATIPAHPSAELVDLSVCVLDGGGGSEPRTLYKTQFAFVTDQKQYMAELLLGSVAETEGGAYPIFPPLPSNQALREYDQSLTDALMDSDLPAGWTLVGYNNHKTINSIQDCTHRETLLHFAARHGLNSLAQYLLSLPGSGMASILPNEQGQLPVDLARQQGNHGLAELLTLFMKQIRPNGVMEDSPLPSPVTSPNHQTESGVSFERENEEESTRHGVKRSLDDVEELSKFKEINDQWKSEIKRHKASLSNSSLNNIVPVHQINSTSPLAPSLTISNEITETTTTAPVDHTPNTSTLRPPQPAAVAASSKTLPQGLQQSQFRTALCKRKRRSSVAVMSSTLTVPPPVIPLESVDFNVTDPSVADMNRKRRTSWSFIVGNCDSRSIDTGLNELDRITAEDVLCKRLLDMREGMVEPEKNTLHDQNHHNNNQLNLLYRLSMSCPMLNEADDEDTLSSFAMSPATSPGEIASPFYAEEAEEEEENGARPLPPPLEFSDRSYSRSDTCSSADSQRHLRPAPAIPEVITTEYSDQTSSAEDLLSADDALDDKQSHVLRRQAQSDSQLLDSDRDRDEVSPSSQQSPGSKESRSMSPSLELLEKERHLAASLKEAKGQSSDANLLDKETAGMSSSAPDLLSMTDEELLWLQSEGRLNQQSNSTDGLEMESIVEHRMLRQQAGSTSPTSDDRTEANLDTSNTSVDEDFVVLTSAVPTSDDGVPTEIEQDDQTTLKDTSATPSSGSPSSRKTASTSSSGGSSTCASSDRSSKTPTPSNSQRLKAHRRSLSTSEVDVMKELRKMSESSTEAAETSNTWKPMADISEAKSSQSLNNGISTGGLIKGGDLGIDLDERSRASSLHTNETFSPHETEESSDEDGDGFHSARENLSKTSLDAEDSNRPPSSSNNLQDSNGKEKSGHKKLSRTKPTLPLEGVVLRNKKGSPSLPSKRYSADHIITSIDDFLEETDDDVMTPTTLAVFSHRRIKSSTASMLPKTSKSDYNLRQHLNSAEEQNESSASSVVGTSSATSQDLQHLTVTSPQQKDSIWSNDSVFDQENDVLNASDIDVKLASDDSFAQSLESSLDHSQTLSAKFERTESSDSLKKRTRKSPLISRKSTIERELPSLRKKGGLSKQDVEPTIKSLRNLLTQDNVEDNLSDDDNVSRGSDKVTFDLQSSASDSVALDNKEDVTQGSTSRAPLSPCPNVSETECSSLDFQPGSPLARKRQAQLAEQTPPHPPSPLSFYQAKSPPGSSQSINSERKFASSSPNSIPSSPAASHKVESESKLSKRRAREEDDELTSLKSISEVTITKHTSRRSQKLKQAMSFDEGPGGVQPYSELLNEMGSTAAPKEQSEDELSDPKQICDIAPPTVKDSDWNLRKVFKGELFRRTKSSKKSSKTKKSGEAEQVHDPAISLVQKQSMIRPKSAARVQSTKANVEDELTFMTPEEYSSHRENQHQLETVASQSANSATLGSAISGGGGGGGGADVRRSVSMQVKTNHAPSSHSRSSSVQVNTNVPLVTLPRRTSDDNLTSPPKRSQSEGHMLSPLEEELSGSGPQGGFPTQPSGESDNEEGIHETERLVSSIVRDPVLAIPNEISWDKTVNRKLYKKMNKTERDRQSILHELLQTEKRYFRVLHVLKLIFRQTLSKHVSEEALNIMFPELHNLIEISNNFSRKLEARSDGMIFEDCSEVLLKQFSGELYERTLESFGNFCSGHLTAVEVYKEHMKKKNFVRIMKDLHSLKECQRLTLPDYYTHVTQHLSKILTLLKRLTTKTETLKLDHAPRLRKALHQLEELMSGVNKMVEYRKNRKELMYIQERLEVGSIPKSDKITNRKDLKNLSLVAYDRMLRKSGEATWIGHGKTLAVHVVLVTDLLVLLTERDQKYHLATLQDLKPPVIRLCDLHVRLDAAVKSGVQILLLEKGPSPEMFRLQFVTKSEARLWDSTLNSAIEECKKRKLNAEHFGEISGEKLLSGDEEKKQEGESDQEEPTVMSTTKKGAPKAVSIIETTSESTSSARAIQRAKDSVELAGRLLTQLSPSNTTTADSSSAQRSHGAAVSSGVTRPFLRDSPKNRQRSHTGHPMRPKTAYYADDGEAGSGSSATISGEHVISYPVPPGTTFSGKSFKQSKEKKKVKLDRSATFKGKEKEKERERERQAAAAAAANASSGVDGGEGLRVPEQQIVECVTKMKEALEEMMTTCEEKEEEIENLRKEKDSKIEKLYDEIAHLREVIQQSRSQEDQSPLMSRHNSHSHAHGHPRPHSVHIDLSDRDDGLDSGESPNSFTEHELSTRLRMEVRNSNLNVKSCLKQVKESKGEGHENGGSSSQETETVNVADTGT